MTRKLASIQKIENIRPIEGADKIEVAQVLGWECVVKKDEFKIGDLVVYVEVDSIMPPKPEFEFLKERKYRVRTIKLRGQVSQGLVLPLSVIPPKAGLYKAGLVGSDVTKILEVTKYDPQAEEEKKLSSTKEMNRLEKFLMRFAWYRKAFGKKNSNPFPFWIAKTDEERVQNIPELFSPANTETMFSVTEKLDGQSATFFLKRGKFGKFDFGVCSRNLRLPVPDNSSYWKVAKQFNIENVLKRIIGADDYVVLQGEIIGEGIQGNKYGIQGLDFYAFNLILANPKEVKKLSSVTLFSIQGKLGIKSVPVVQFLWELPKTVMEAVDFSKGLSKVNPKIQREGVVVRNHTRSFKIINPNFLLKYDE